MGLKKEIKETIETAKKLGNGTYKSKYTGKQVLWGMCQALKSPFFYIFVMILIFSAMSGFLFGAKKTMYTCNEYIRDTFADPESPFASPLLIMQQEQEDIYSNLSFELPET